MAILRQMTEGHYKRYIEEFQFLIDLRDFLMEILTLFHVLVGDDVFAADWLEMVMLQNRCVIIG